jgi:hypothetical protein
MGVGMFDKDKSFGVDVTDMFALKTPFYLWGAAVLPERVCTKLDNPEADPATWTRKTLLIVSSVDAPAQLVEATSLASAIADKAEQAEPADFPCRVELRSADSSFGGTALVLQWLGDVDDQLAGLGGGRMNHATGVVEDAGPAPAPKRQAARASS